jgi:hypothetical protein
MPKTIWGGKIDGRTKIGKDVAIFDELMSLVFLPFKLAFSWFLCLLNSLLGFFQVQNSAEFNLFLGF